MSATGKSKSEMRPPCPDGREYACLPREAVPIPLWTKAAPRGLSLGAWDRFDKARIEAENIKAGADQYALDSLMNLERELTAVANQVRNGISVLEQKRPPAIEGDK